MLKRQCLGALYDMHVSSSSCTMALTFQNAVTAVLQAAGDLGRGNGVHSSSSSLDKRRGRPIERPNDLANGLVNGKGGGGARARGGGGGGGPGGGEGW
jgi:hypothetical protein